MPERIRWSSCVLSLAAAGCNLSMTPPPESDFTGGDPDSSAWVDAMPLDLRDARIAGRLGDVDHLENGSRTIRGYGTGGESATVEIHVTTPDGAAMAVLSIYPSLDDPRIVPGASFHQEGENEWDEGALELDVLGCAGPQEGQWDYDQLAEEVDVTVTDEDGDDCLEIAFVGTYSRYQTSTGRPETVTGSFEVGANLE